MESLAVRTCLALAVLTLLSGPVSGAPPELPPITDEQRSLTEVKDHPNAPAVVLFQKGHFTILDPKNGSYRPTFTVTVRRKILTEEGKRYGEVVLHHSRRVRLRELQARTVLPDGRIIPVGEDALFRRQTSRKEKTFTTSIAFPAVQVGAILDYRFQIRQDSPFLVEPWTFQEEVPTLFSEIVYDVPELLAVRFWMQDPFRVGIQKSVVARSFGSRITVSGSNLPPVPREPHGPAFADLAARFHVLPVEVWNETKTKKTDLFSTWQSTCALMAEEYEKFGRRAGAAQRRAREIAERAGSDRRARAEALYRFVRDEIETGDAYTGVGLPDGSTADAVLAARSGLPTEKALLLRTLLSAAGIQSRLVWVPERGEGLVNLELASPWWFDRAILAVEVEGQRLFLDPTDRTLAFGHLLPAVEDMQAILFDTKDPRVLRMPTEPFQENLRHARVELALDAAGRLAGRGTLRLTGHHAWSRLGWQPDAAQTAEAWKRWLAESWSGFEIGDLRVSEDIEARRVEVAWTLAEREEEVLGDESTLTPSRPLGPSSQPFQLPAERRVSPVLFPFPDRDEVELTLRWPEGWAPETLPREVRHESRVGAVVVGVELDEAARTLTYRRRLDLPAREYGKPDYGALQGLFGAAARSDADPLVLRRR